MSLKKPGKHDTIRLIFFSPAESEIRQFEFNFRRLVMMALMTAVILTIVFVSSVIVCDRLFQNNTDVHISKSNSFLKEQVNKLQDSIAGLNSTLAVIEDDAEDLEVLAGLRSTTSDSNFVSSFSTNSDLMMASFPVYESGSKLNVAQHLNDLESRINQARNIQNLIEDKFLQPQMGIRFIPSIRPVEGARITDKFGNRRDPFIERVKHHNGIDLSARYGTKVFASAAGIVEFTRVKYRMNSGYGRVVIINHGNGFKTLYGHLATVSVARGQKVERWDNIGLSGDSGRATGPHLHYEVWRDGQPENPENYILN